MHSTFESTHPGAPEPSPAHRLSLARIERAYGRIDPVFRDSPQFDCEPLSRALGVHSAVLKVETANPLRSFKGRGADFFMQENLERLAKRPLVCASAGNWGQAMAWSCRALQRKLTVYAARNANEFKLARIREMGAEVRLFGEDFDSAKAEAKRWCDEAGAVFVEDGAAAEVSEGAGTIGLELLRGGASIEVLLIPLGNGALATGIGRWVKAHAPNVQVIAVAASGADAMAASWRAGKVVERASVQTIADGIAVRVPVSEAVDDMRGTLDDVVLVDDDAIQRAMRLVWRHAGQLVEPAGAAGVAAMLAHPHWRGLRVATVLCGSNLTGDQIARWLA